MQATPEFPVTQTEGLYGYSVLDVAIGKLRNIGYSGVRWAGIALVITGAVTFTTDTLITGNAADINGFRKISPERTTFLNDYRGSRSSIELGAVVAGVGLMAAGSLRQARRNAAFN